MCTGAQAHELIGERTRSALAFKRENGQPNSHPPLGFTANGNRERMVPVPKELRAGSPPHPPFIHFFPLPPERLSFLRVVADLIHRRRVEDPAVDHH